MPNPKRAREMVHRDCVIGFEETVPDRGAGGWATHEGFERNDARPIADFDADNHATVVVVPWRWTGEQTGTLLGVPPTDPPRVLTIRGVTLVQDDDTQDDGLILHRFVDWGTTLEELEGQRWGRPVTDVRKAGGDRFLDVEHFRLLVEEGLL